MPALANVPGAEVLLRSDGEYLALFNDVWALRRIEKNHPEVFLYAHQHLNKIMGGTNTVVLILSSFTMAWSIKASACIARA